VAIRNAVRQGAGVWIESRSKVDNFELIRDAIYARSRGYVTRYEEVRRYKDGPIYCVEIDADVAIGKISTDDWPALQLLIELVGRPNFVVEVDVQGDAKAEQVIPWVRGKLNDKLELLGLRVTFEPVRKESLLRDYVNAINAGNEKRARSLKAKLGAPFGVIVTASATVKDEKAWDAELKTATVNLQGTVVSRSSADILASKSSSSQAKSGADAATAVKNACEKAADELFESCLDRIIERWATQVDKGVLVEVEATELKLAELAQVQKVLESVDKVLSVKMVSSPAGGIGVLEVRGLVNDEIVAKALLSVRGPPIEPEILGPGRVGIKKQSDSSTRPK
jgi:hypothetical protein